MIASEKRADGPAYGKTFIIRTRCCGLPGQGKAKTSVMSATGSAMALGPEMWSDISEDLLYGLPLLLRKLAAHVWPAKASLRCRGTGQPAATHAYQLWHAFCDAGLPSSTAVLRPANARTP